MKNFTLIVPTRKRPDYLRAYLESVDKTVRNHNRIFIRIIYDYDDNDTHNLISSIPNYKFKIYWHKRERSNFINDDYYNFGCKNSSVEESDYLFANADDIRYIAVEWDAIIEHKIEAFCNNKSDRLVGIGIKDNTPKPKPTLPQFPCFPLVTRESFNHFGFLLHPFIPTWGADYLFYLLYTGADRYLAIDNRVYMNHMGIHTKTGPKDETAAHVEKVFNTLKMNQKHNVDFAKDNILPQQIREFRQHLHSINKG